MGSAKILSLGKLTGLSETETLNLFGRFYRQDVLENPEGTDHANIRNLIKGGWGCVDFPNGLAINPKLAEFSTSTSAVEEVRVPMPPVPMPPKSYIDLLESRPLSAIALV